MVQLWNAFTGSLSLKRKCDFDQICATGCTTSCHLTTSRTAIYENVFKLTKFSFQPSQDRFVYEYVVLPIQNSLCRDKMILRLSYLEIWTLNYYAIISYWGDTYPISYHCEKKSIKNELMNWGRVTHICVGKLTIIGSDNGLSPGRHQAIIWTNAGLLLIGLLGTNFSEILITIQAFSFKKMHLKISSVKWRPFSLGLNVLIVPTKSNAMQLPPHHAHGALWL